MKKNARKLSLKKHQVITLAVSAGQLQKNDQLPAQQKCSGEDCFSRMSCWPTKPF
jgi:hypothetical protein